MRYPVRITLPSGRVIVALLDAGMLLMVDELNERGAIRGYEIFTRSQTHDDRTHDRTHDRHERTETTPAA